MTFGETRLPGSYEANEKIIKVGNSYIGMAGSTAHFEVMRRVLMAMETTEEGRKALKDFQKTTRFDRFPAGIEATFAPIHAMLDRLEPGVTN